jgi:hypothetical protein
LTRTGSGLKLRALAAFRKYGDAFCRIEAMAEIDGRMKVIDTKIAPVRQAVLHGKDSPDRHLRSDIAIEDDPEDLHGGP